MYLNFDLIEFIIGTIFDPNFDLKANIYPTFYSNFDFMKILPFEQA